MTFEEPFLEILQEARRLARDVPGASWYGFGSYFRRQYFFGDIDILVVCSTTADAIAVRMRTEEICSRWPIHLVIMTEAEEQETCFIASEKAIALNVILRS